MKKVTDKEFWMENYLKDNLDLAKEAVRKKWDVWLSVTGIEGSGKTTFTCSCAYYVCYDKTKGKSTFGIDNIVWTVDQFKKALVTVPVGSAIVWDEAVFGLLSTESMGQVQRTLVQYATTIRKRRLFVFLVIPYIFMLGKYFVSRSRGMFLVRTEDGITRGKFSFYNKSQLMYLYAEGKKHWNYPRNCKISFHGNHVVKNLTQLGIDEEEYERRKDLAIKSLYQRKEVLKERADKYRHKFYYVIGKIKEDKELIWKDIPKLYPDINMSYLAIQRGYSRYLEDLEQKKLKPNKYLLPNGL